MARLFHATGPDCGAGSHRRVTSLGCYRAVVRRLERFPDEAKPSLLAAMTVQSRAQHPRIMKPLCVKWLFWARGTGPVLPAGV